MSDFILNKKRHLLICFALVILCLYSHVYPSSIESGAWIKSWHLCGPFLLKPFSVDMDVDHLEGFESDYLESYGGEKKVDVKESQVFKINDSTPTWFEHASTAKLSTYEKLLPIKNMHALMGIVKWRQSSMIL